jgi:outer membrane biosynthesis protein TonB
MAKDRPSQSYSESFRDRAGAASGRFWRNVVLIALAHVVLIGMLIRWSLAARASPNGESIVWLGNAGELATGESQKHESPSPKDAVAPNESKQVKNNEVEEREPVATTAKSEIELPSATPKPTPPSTPAPKRSARPAPKPKVTPKPLTRPTPKKTPLAKVSSKPSPKALKERRSPDRRGEAATAKSVSPSQGTGKTSSTGKTGSAGGGSSASEFGWYGNMLHDRFYSAWIQPTTNVPSGTKFSALANLRIEKDGRVSKFEIIKPSENPVVNESVAAVAKQVSHVDPPPAALIKGDHYDVKINFELNTEEKAEN